MQFPTTLRPTIGSVPPIYAWPRTVKQILLGLSVIGVIFAYMLLTGGFLAMLAIAAERMSGN
jgi:hypothetical protein